MRAFWAGKVLDMPVRPAWGKSLRGRLDLLQAYLVGPARGTGCRVLRQPAWRFMGSHKWGYKSPNMSYKYSYPT